MKTYSDLPTLVKVKIMAFASSGADGDLDIWKQALSLLSSSDRESQPQNFNISRIIKPFTVMVDLVCFGMIRDTIMLDECRVAFKSAIDIMISKYPNVSSIIAMPTQPHEFFQKLILELAVGYDKQLAKYVCSMPTTVPYTLLAPNLVELDLRFIHSWTLKFPTIYPRSLRKIDIMFQDVSIDWDVFRVDKESKTIVFDNLTDLSITGDSYIPELRDVANANNLDLKFPNLERLFLSSCNLTKKDGQALMSHKLNWLHFEGSFIAASQLCKQPLRKLDTLFLAWLGLQHPEETDDFISLANEIFNKTDGIKHVQCEICSESGVKNVDGVDWPYLTHLSLAFMMPFKDLFDMLPKVPNLVHLDILINNCSDNELTEATEFLANIKKHYPAPSSSKIKSLRLIDENTALHSYSRCKQTFGGVIEDLKWYCPQLRDIKFQES
ncbi:hypothetical protein J3B01_004095 [Coemansia erecta]|nr:hypothetical protein J3B01_004095 [Coemansia erecta]